LRNLKVVDTRAHLVASYLRGDGVWSLMDNLTDFLTDFLAMCTPSVNSLNAEELQRAMEHSQRAVITTDNHREAKAVVP
ncbi:hypothetical protein FRC17_008563, partial [Serendipita sp. 399]